MTKTDSLDPIIPDRFLRYYMRAVEEQMGKYSLHLMLSKSGLERYTSAAPSDDLRTIVHASKFSSFFKAIRDYYGRGARGSLIRIGEMTFDKMLDDAFPLQKVRLSMLRKLPIEVRCKKVLQYLAQEMRESSGEIRIYPADPDWIIVDKSNSFTYGQAAGEPICWPTIGMIQAALLWATGANYEVEEISCIASGSNACQFKISRSSQPTG